MLDRLWMEDMYALVQTYGGTSTEILVDLLKYEADTTTI
jgi:hypothetical protein